MKENKKNISEISYDEILRQQLELLAERSIKCSDNELCSITNTMVNIYNALLDN